MSCRQRFKKVFSSYLEDEVSGGDLEDIYREAHEKIREDPSYTKTEKDLDAYKKASKANKPKKISKDQRAANVKAKVQAYQAGQEE